ncbi:RNA polymerase sigma factor [Anditalea andensis]|uniref:RNA polymerase sigma-70 factor n=1 Tax=Anditalea andensis TaxID=1048983 RepID=A0A074KW84_9BACT|nr:RNA polymerase sigma-70 factor [Anditalea andensis]KEO74231.1 hypothetical protein EL17_08850 [Anditalea andensis]
MFSEKQLVEQLKQSNTDAYGRLYHLYVQRLYGFVLRMAKSPELAEDIVQDIFIKLWENRDQLDPDKCIKAYMFTMAKNQLLNFIKRKAHESRIIDEILAHVPRGCKSTDNLVLENEIQQLLDEALSSLPPQRKLIFELCRIQGLTYKQAADQLGLSDSTVNSQMVKAIRSIKEFLKEKDVALPVVIIAVAEWLIN